jgi:hypothetical protein
MGYLVCNRCGGYYRLHEGESPDEFQDRCECGGKLEYYDNLGGKLNKGYESIGSGYKTPTEHYFIPILLIMVSVECILSIFYSLIFIMVLGIIGLIFGLIFLLIRIKGLENRLYFRSRQMIYLIVSILFLVESYALVILWFQIDNYGEKK